MEKLLPHLRVIVFRLVVGWQSAGDIDLLFQNDHDENTYHCSVVNNIILRCCKRPRYCELTDIRVDAIYDVNTNNALSSTRR